MERFYLITNRAKDPDLTVTDQIRQYLEERGKTCLLCDNSEKGEKYHYTDPAKVPSDIDPGVSASSALILSILLQQATWWIYRFHCSASIWERSAILRKSTVTRFIRRWII